ncbi:MAG: GEVED domain-containing protein [Bacteroidota bacterium]|nr:GEVED domain-containing protein [Bacteroidota bacterium]
MKKLLLTLITAGAFYTASAQTIILSETFTGQIQPAGWSNDSLGNPNVFQWQFNNPGVRVVTGANFDADFAILDSDFYGTGNLQNSSLSTPSFSTIGFTGCNLVFSEQFREYPASQQDIDYSIDGGTTWTSLRTGTANIGYPNPAVSTTISLPAPAINQADVRIKFTYIGDYGWWWAIDDISVIGLNNCSGTPTAGTIAGCPSSVCANVPYDLTLTGSSIDVGVTYQWMSSTNGTVFNPIAGATGLTLHDSITIAPMYYQVVVTCTGSGLSSTSPAVSVTSINPLTACYCVPTHFDCTDPDFISTTSISSTTLNNNDSICSTTPNGAYSIYPASGNTTATLTQGSSYSLNVTTQDDDIISCWIDFDQNGSFDPTEWTQVCTTSTPNTVNTISIPVPMSAAVGLTGMRIRSRLSGNTNDAASACIYMGSGECEDYFVTIAPFVGIKENTSSQFSMFPNPAKNLVTIKISKEQTGSIITVVDMLGNKVIENLSPKNNELSINLDSLSNGVYFVSIENGKVHTTKKLIVSK